MAKIASIRNLDCLRFGRPDEAEGVAANVNAIDCLRDLRHVAGNALAAGTTSAVMRVLLNAGGKRTVLCVRPVAGQAKGIAPFAHDAGIVGAVWIVTTETRYAARIHEALNEIVPLHAIFVSGAVSKMGEGCFPKLVFL